MENPFSFRCFFSPNPPIYPQASDHPLFVYKNRIAYLLIQIVQVGLLDLVDQHFLAVQVHQFLQTYLEVLNCQGIQKTPWVQDLQCHQCLQASLCLHLCLIAQLNLGGQESLSHLEILETLEHLDDQLIL